MKKAGSDGNKLPLKAPKEADYEKEEVTGRLAWQQFLQSYISFSHQMKKKKSFFLVDDVYSHMALAKLNNVMHLVSLLVPTGGLEPLLTDSIGSKTSVELRMRKKRGLSIYYCFFLYVLFPKWIHF